MINQYCVYKEIKSTIEHFSQSDFDSPGTVICTVEIKESMGATNILWSSSNVFQNGLESRTFSLRH